MNTLMQLLPGITGSAILGGIALIAWAVKVALEKEAPVPIKQAVTSPSSYGVLGVAASPTYQGRIYTFPGAVVGVADAPHTYTVDAGEQSRAVVTGKVVLERLGAVPPQQPKQSNWPTD